MGRQQSDAVEKEQRAFTSKQWRRRPEIASRSQQRMCESHLSPTEREAEAIPQAKATL